MKAVENAPTSEISYYTVNRVCHLETRVLQARSHGQAIFKIAPYSRKSTFRGSSPTLAMESGKEHWNSMLLRPPLMTLMWNWSSRRPLQAPGRNSLHHR